MQTWRRAFYPYACVHARRVGGMPPALSVDRVHADVLALCGMDLSLWFWVLGIGSVVLRLPRLPAALWLVTRTRTRYGRRVWVGSAACLPALPACCTRAAASRLLLPLRLLRLFGRLLMVAADARNPAWRNDSVCAKQALTWRLAATRSIRPCGRRRRQRLLWRERRLARNISETFGSGMARRRDGKMLA